MCKYKKDDKVVIRKDLIVGEVYGELVCLGRMVYLKEKDYVVIEEVDGGYYDVEGLLINDEMIEGLYEPHNEITKKVLLRNGTTVECNAKYLLVVNDMKGIKDIIKKYPNLVVILSSEILVIK